MIFSLSIWFLFLQERLTTFLEGHIGFISVFYTHQSLLIKFDINILIIPSTFPP